MKTTTTTARVKVSGATASELDMRFEVAEVGDVDWAVLAQWDGKAIHVFDKDHADRLAFIVCEMANDMDRQKDAGEIPGDDAKWFGLAMKGLWNLSERLRAV